MGHLSLNFGPEDILAFEEVYGTSGELHEIHITLKNGSHQLYKELREICEILDVLKELKTRERTQLPARPTKLRLFGFELS